MGKKTSDYVPLSEEEIRAAWDAACDELGEDAIRQAADNLTWWHAHPYDGPDVPWPDDE
jgi:hypothetical protein